MLTINKDVIGTILELIENAQYVVDLTNYSKSCDRRMYRILDSKFKTILEVEFNYNNKNIVDSRNKFLARIKDLNELYVHKIYK